MPPHRAKYYVQADPLKEIPATWLAEKMGMTVREIKRMRNGKVHLTTATRDRLAMVMRQWKLFEKRKPRVYRKRVVVGRLTRDKRRAIRAVIKERGGIKRPVASGVMGWHPFSKRLQSVEGLDLDTIRKASMRCMDARTAKHL